MEISRENWQRYTTPPHQRNKKTPDLHTGDRKDPPTQELEPCCWENRPYGHWSSQAPAGRVSQRTQDRHNMDTGLNVTEYGIRQQLTSAILLKDDVLLRWLSVTTICDGSGTNFDFPDIPRGQGMQHTTSGKQVMADQTKSHRIVEFWCASHKLLSCGLNFINLLLNAAFVHRQRVISSKEIMSDAALLTLRAHCAADLKR